MPQPPVYPSVPGQVKHLPSISTHVKQMEFCRECCRRDELLHDQHQRLHALARENRLLTEKLRVSIRCNYHNGNDNVRLRHRLQCLNAELHSLRIAGEKKTQFDKEQTSNATHDIDHVRRLRHELYDYNQAVAAKLQEEEEQEEQQRQRRHRQKRFGYFYVV
jgi:hypothetical protein